MQGGRRCKGGGTIFVVWFHSAVACVVGPAELVGSALIRGRTSGTLADGTSGGKVGGCTIRHTSLCISIYNRGFLLAFSTRLLHLEQCGE